MEEMSLVQARTPERVKASAMDILERLGLNMSTYINMSLNQLIIQEGIPFPVKVNSSAYTSQELISEVEATLGLEGMQLTAEDIEMLRAIKGGSVTADEMRKRILRGV